METSFDVKSALAEIITEIKKKPKRGRKKGSKNNVKIEFAPETDPERISLIEEITAVYIAEGYEWLLQENPREKYTTEQLRIHVQKLRDGHRAWKMPLDWRAQ